MMVVVGSPHYGGGWRSSDTSRGISASTNAQTGGWGVHEVTEVVDDEISPIIERPRAITHMQPIVLEYL